jgi:catechol 2,3-dioxygenase-like lactoylglutathione lyase family enzyme
MIRGIHHTAISTGDLERAVRFYRDLLGFSVVLEFQWPVGMAEADAITGLKDSSARAVMLKAGNMMIELFQYSSPTPKRSDANRPVCDHGITHIALDVTDVDAEYERLKAAGMRFHCPPQEIEVGGVKAKATYGRDPDGNVVEIQQVIGSESPIALPLG